jgi:hypothetical protein
MGGLTLSQIRLTKPPAEPQCRNDIELRQSDGARHNFSIVMVKYALLNGTELSHEFINGA